MTHAAIGKYTFNIPKNPPKSIFINSNVNITIERSISPTIIAMEIYNLPASWVYSFSSCIPNVIGSEGHNFKKRKEINQIVR